MDCPACRDGRCSECPDRIMALLDKPRACSCGRNGHEDAILGEPRREQVVDPFTEDVHGPGLVVRAETGEVEFTASQNPSD